jgi:hypothetical protein
MAEKQFGLGPAINISDRVSKMLPLHRIRHTTAGGFKTQSGGIVTDRSVFYEDLSLSLSNVFAELG